MNPSLQQPSDPEIAKLEQLVDALRKVARLAGQCADHASSRSARSRLWLIEARADEHLRRLLRRVPHEPDKIGSPRIRLRAL